MKKRVFLASLAVSIFWGCGSSDPQKVDLKGTWKHTVENGISGGKEEETISVTAKGNKFKLTTQTAMSESTRVYDGQTLYTKNRYRASALPHEADAAMESDATESDVSAQQTTDTETGSERFWANALVTGRGEAGGAVAGRDTLLHQIREKRPEGELSQQIWLDAKTGVTLKSTLTIYSSQISSMVRKEDWECQSIDYSPVEDAVFLRP